MLDVYKFIKEELYPEQTSEYKQYTQKMDALFNELSLYFPEKKEDVYYPPISEKDYKRISKVFDEAAVASNNYIASNKNIIPENRKDLPPTQDVAINLNNEFFSKAYVEFKNIKPNPHFSLKDQMEDFRYMNVEIKSNELKKLGAAQSSRTKMTVDINGKNVNGVFTNKSFYNGKERVGELLPRMAEKYPKYASFFKSIDLDNFYKNGAVYINFTNYFTDKGEFVAPEQKRRAVSNLMIDSNMTRAARNEANKYKNEPDFYNACVDFATEMSKLNVSISLNRNVIGMKDGDRIDSRNSAMSGVANLIGCPDVIAKARPLVIYDDKGHKYDEGTFMEFAKGRDINTIPPVDVLRTLSSDDFDTPEAKRQVANLQVLDYICGNIDRHAGNMLYNIDPKTRKLVGVVGIDNDCAFMKRDMDINEPVGRMPSINTLRVIDSDMAETIKNLDEGQLKATLHGYGLDKEAIDAAWKRTLQLKTAIRNGVDFAKNNYQMGGMNLHEGSITIVNKNDWDKTNLADCHQGLENYFETLQNVPRSYSRPLEMDPKSIARKNIALAGLKTAMGKSQTGYLYKKAKDNSPWFFASNRYKNILTKVKEYHETPIEGNNPLSQDNAQKFVKLNEMKAAIDVYKREKISDGYIDDNWNLKRDLSGKDLDRLLFVKDMETYVKRIEKEKEIAKEAKKVYDEKKTKVEKVNSFLRDKQSNKDFYINKQMEQEIKEQEKEVVDNESVHVSSDISNDISFNNNIISNKNNNIIVDSEDEFEINTNTKIVDKEEEKVVYTESEKEEFML